MTPDHGTRARYLRGCACDACATAHNRYCKAYKYRTKCARHGGPTAPVRVPSAPVVAHLRKLLASGLTRTDIADESGVPETTVRATTRGRYATIHPRTADRLLAVEPLPAPDPLYVDPVLVDRIIRAAWNGDPAPYRAANTRHRRRALAALTASGWSTTRIAAWLGVGKGTAHTLTKRARQEVAA